jgi:hypothetical protein
MLNGSKAPMLDKQNNVIHGTLIKWREGKRIG